MVKPYLLKILILFILPTRLIAYDFTFQNNNNLLKLDFEDNLIKEIKFDININGQRNFGIINYHNDEIYISYDPAKLHNYLIKNNFKLIKKFKFPFTTWEDRIYFNDQTLR